MDNNFYILCNLPTTHSSESQQSDETIKPVQKWFDNQSGSHSIECWTGSQLSHSDESFIAANESQVMELDPLSSLLNCSSPNCQ